MLATIPFSGFYCSAHDAELDRALEQAIGGSSGDPIPGLLSRAFDAAPWGFVHQQYAEHYAGRFLAHFGIAGTFESLQSPREYNFTTDRIFCEIAEPELRRILADVSASVLRECAREWFTSCSGFHSFYEPDPYTWGDLSTWDHNQCGCLLAAYVSEQRDGEPFDGFEQVDLMESARDNGRFEHWLCAAPEFLRVANVAGYLRDREARA